MATNRAFTSKFSSLLVLLVLFGLVNLSLGSVTIPLDEIISILTGGVAEKQSWHTIIINYRLPKIITAIMVGSGLSISGLLMQTFFRNPLAGPFVLGISSGASLGVALLLLGGGLLGTLLPFVTFYNIHLTLAAILGAFLVLSVVIIVANYVKNTMSILIIGLMFGSISSAIINVLSYFSSSDQIQQYVFWNFGSLGDLSWQEVGILTCICCLCFISILGSIKPLNSFLLGEHYAKSLGINTKRSQTIILVIASILTGTITAFSGPIAFIGLAVPHIAKLIFSTSNHKLLIPATGILGAIILLLCDSIAQLPTSEFSLPINAVTSLVGAPVVIWLLIRKKKIYV